MARYAAGDGAAFEELFRRFEPRAFAFFLRRTGSAERAEDLYQELFLRLHRARRRYDPSRPFTPWFFQIAHRLLVDDFRRAFRSRETPIDGHAPSEPRPGCETRLVHRQELDGLLEALSPQERDVLVRAKIDGVAYLDLAQEMERSVDAVKKLVSRALQRLRAAARAASEDPASVGQRARPVSATAGERS